jgi:energy-converting hydrogenase Eha subunit A
VTLADELCPVSSTKTIQNAERTTWIFPFPTLAEGISAFV